MLDQLKALIALRLCLVRHTFSKGKMLSMVWTAIVILSSAVIGLAAGIGLLFLGASLKPNDALGVLIGIDVFVVLFVFFWLFALLMELQRSDVIDLRKMLYLPVSPGMVFVLNYAVSLVSPALFFFVLPSVGFCTGLAFSFGPRMLLGIPLALVFYLMLGAWTYYVRGMLVILMENKRRRRVILAVLPLLFMLVFQLPNLLSLSLRGNGKQSAQSLEREWKKMAGMSGIPPERMVAYAHAAIPLAWLPYGAYALTGGKLGTAGLCLAGEGLFTALGLGLGLRSTWRYYTAAGRRKRRRASPIAQVNTRSSRPRRRLMDISLPYVDDDTAAATLAAFLGYIRHPNIRIALVMPVLVFLFVILALSQRLAGKSGIEATFPLLLATFFPFLSLGFILFNIFGIDAEGFRTYVLLPTERRKLLLGKNLAMFPFVGGVAIFFVVIFGIITGIGFSAVAISLLQVFQLYLVFCAAGNITSVYFLYRVHWEGMSNRANVSPIMFLVGLFMMFLVAALFAPTALCIMIDSLLATYWGYHGMPLGLLISVALLVVAIFVYSACLRTAGDLLMQREQRILDKLVRGKE